MTIKKNFINLLVCPKTGSKLTLDNNYLINERGDNYPIVESIPVLLTEKTTTLWVANASYAAARNNKNDKYYINTLGITKSEIKELQGKIKNLKNFKGVDPVISYLQLATSGYMYSHLVGTNLSVVPIPKIDLPNAKKNEILLDIGCNWGRWSIAAAKLGYRVIGIDPSLGAVLAAKRLAEKFEVDHLTQFIVGDAMNLPLKDESIDIFFSYSVFQHFSKNDFEISLKEAYRVSKQKAYLFIQMANILGIRSLYWIIRRKFRKARDFEVRFYWPFELKKIVSKIFGTTGLSVDSILGLGIQPNDYNLMTIEKKFIIILSKIHKKLSNKIKFLTYFADSIYVRSYKK